MDAENAPAFPRPDPLRVPALSTRSISEALLVALAIIN
jgi:hypothetical protein